MSELASAFAFSSRPAVRSSFSQNSGNINNMPRNFYHRSVMASPLLEAQPRLPVVGTSYSTSPNYQLHYPQMEMRNNQFPVIGISPSSSYSSSLSTSSSFSSSSSTEKTLSNSTSSSPPVLKSSPFLYDCILGDLGRLYNGTSALETDFTIITIKNADDHPQYQAHHAHRFVLSFRSRYFESLFRFRNLQEDKIGSNELVLEDVSGEVMAAILRYIYLGTFTFESVGQLMELIIAADRFLLEELVFALTEAVLADLAPENVISVFKIASEFNFTQLIEASSSFIFDHGYLMLQEPSFIKSLNIDELIFFIADDRFCTVEDELVPFILKYIKEHQVEEKDEINRLLDVIRFSMLVDGPKMLAMLDPTEELTFELIVTKYDKAEEKAEIITCLQEETKTKLETENETAMSLSSFVRPLTTSTSSTTSSPSPTNFTTTSSTSTTTSSSTLVKNNEKDENDKVDEDLPYRNCYNYSTLKLYEGQLKGETFSNGSSVFAVRAPLYLTLTFDRKIVLNRINFYLRAASSLHVWFEWIEKYEVDDDDDKNFEKLHYHQIHMTKWHHLTETHSWGANRAFEIKLNKPIFARNLRMHFKPVADDLSYLPVSLFNLAFTMDFPRERLIGSGKNSPKMINSNEINNNNKEDDNGDNENDSPPAFVY